MSLIAFLDTEYHERYTAELLKLAADDARAPRLASVAWFLYDEASLEVPQGVFYSLVLPRGWTMSQGAYEVNKLEMATLERLGMPIEGVMGAWADLLQLGKSEPLTIVTHGTRTDLKLMRGELRRAGYEDFYETTRSFCTMQKNTKELGLKQEGSNRPKWPSLPEVYNHYFSKPVPGHHTAFNDALAVKKIYVAMKEKGMDMSPYIPKAGGKESAEVAADGGVEQSRVDSPPPDAASAAAPSDDEIEDVV